MKRSLTFSLVLFVVITSNSTLAQTTNPDLSTPEAAFRAFLQALDQRDIEALFRVSYIGSQEYETGAQAIQHPDFSGEVENFNSCLREESCSGNSVSGGFAFYIEADPSEEEIQELNRLRSMSSLPTEPMAACNGREVVRIGEEHVFFRVNGEWLRLFYEGMYQRICD